MAVDVETLLAPVSDDNPAGDDLSYDGERQEIEAAFETSAGGGAANEGDIDWRAIVRLIEGQSARTKDIWLAVYMMRAGARMAQIDIVERGARYLAGLVANYWDTVHPQLEEYGFQGRKAPCEALTRIGEFLGPLKNIILIRHPRLGEYSSVDIERFTLNGDNEDGYGLFRAAVQEVPPEELDAVVAQIDAIAEAIRTADGIMTSNADGGTSVNFAATYEALKSMRSGLAAFTSSGADIAETEVAEAGNAPASGGSSSGARPGLGAPGAVESREDVIRSIDAIADYYRRKEPTSPVPLALKRARDWVNLDFMAVLEDIAPNSLHEARTVLMAREKEEGY